MGCHTWFYRKVEEVPTIEAQKEYCKLNMKSSIDELNDKLSTCDEINKPIMLEYIEECTKFNESLNETTLLDDEITYWYIQLRLDEISKQEYKLNKDNPYYSGIGPYIVHDNSLYINVDKYHDIFRVYSYPEDILTNYDETVQYIKTKITEDNAKLYESSYKLLKEFFNEYPDGIIDFG